MNIPISLLYLLLAHTADFPVDGNAIITQPCLFAGDSALLTMSKYNVVIASNKLQKYLLTKTKNWLRRLWDIIRLNESTCTRVNFPLKNDNYIPIKMNGGGET